MIESQLRLNKNRRGSQRVRTEENFLLIGVYDITDRAKMRKIVFLESSGLNKHISFACMPASLLFGLENRLNRRSLDRTTNETPYHVCTYTKITDIHMLELEGNKSHTWTHLEYAIFHTVEYRLVAVGRQSHCERHNDVRFVEVRAKNLQI